jgi:hypothetical protein
VNIDVTLHHNNEGTEMSRTQKGSKAPGYEYWGKRPGSGHFAPGKYAKRVTHKAERQQGKKDSSHDDA